MADKVTQSLVWMGVENAYGWRSCHLSVLHHFQGVLVCFALVLLYMKSDLPLL